MLPNKKQSSKELEELEEIMKNTTYIKFTLYTKGNGNNWYCDYYMYDGTTYETGTTKALGYGYDKQSTALSNAINKYKNMYTLKKGLKWESETSAHATNNYNKKRYYGIYKDKTISYGIGLSSVINCLECFKNVKIIEKYEGQKEIYLKIAIN